MPDHVPDGRVEGARAGEVAGMPSVIVAWKGVLGDRAMQDELLGSIRRFAGLSAEYCAADVRLPRFSETLADRRRRERGAPEPPNIEIFDTALEGDILIRSDVLAEADAYGAAAGAAGLMVAPEEAGSGYLLARVSAARLHGIRFRLYDPRRLYPGSDRLSFIFVECPEAPFLDGALVDLRPGPEMAGHLPPAFAAADWYLECPFVHLRYVLEDWTFRLLSWVRYFYIPGLYWRGRDELDHLAGEAALYDGLSARDGRDAARQEGFFLLMEDFRVGADEWTERFEALRAEEDEWDG
jgi:hypothetical protein